MSCSTWNLKKRIEPLEARRKEEHKNYKRYERNNIFSKGYERNNISARQQDVTCENGEIIILAQEAAIFEPKFGGPFWPNYNNYIQPIKVKL